MLPTIYFSRIQGSFAKGNNWKKTFLNFHQVIYSLSSISCPSLKLQAVIISNFLCPNLQRAITKKKKKKLFLFSPGYLLIMLY